MPQSKSMDDNTEYNHHISVPVHHIQSVASLYQRELLLYQAALELVEGKVHTLIKEFQLNEDRSPIDNVQARLKSPQSIADKLQRKGYPMTLNSIRENILDIAGIRLVCPFIRDVYSVAEMLLRQKDIHLVRVKDYIREPKPNGYRSLHLIITVDVNLSDSCHTIPVELQLRTIAMNCWAGTEHQLRYKKDRPLTAEDEDELRQVASLMRLADEKMQRLADRLLDAADIPFPDADQLWPDDSQR